MLREKRIFRCHDGRHMPTTSQEKLLILRHLFSLGGSTGGRIQPKGGYLEHRDYSAGAGQRARTLRKTGADEGSFREYDV